MNRRALLRGTVATLALAAFPIGTTNPSWVRPTPVAFLTFRIVYDEKDGSVADVVLEEERRVVEAMPVETVS